MTELEQKILDIQCETTKKLLIAQSLRSPEDDKDYISRIRLMPIAMEAQCLKEDGTVDLNVRPTTPEEMEFHDRTRKSRGSLIEMLRGDDGRSTLTAEKRDRAVNAFVAKFSVEAIKEKFKALMNGLFKPSHAEIVADHMKGHNED